MGRIGELCWNNIWFHVWYVFESPFEYILVNKLWKHIWVLGDQNWRFWMKNGKNAKVVVQNCDCTFKRAPKCAPSVQPLVATGPCTLKRTSPVSAPQMLKHTSKRLTIKQNYKEICLSLNTWYTISGVHNTKQK